MNYQFKKLVMNLPSVILIFIDLHSQIEEINQKISVKQNEKDDCLEYKNVGSKIEAKKIMSLEKDIKEVKDVFHRATGQFTAVNFFGQLPAVKICFTAGVKQVLEAFCILLVRIN